jgi:agmatine deiminase
VSGAEVQYRMPPEWAPHRAVWTAWPHREASWPGRFEPVPAAFARMIAAIAPYTPVHINLTPELRDEATAVLREAGAPMKRILFHDIATDDAWLRDTGPIVVEGADGGQAALDWRFNAWGGKYEPFDKDDAVASRVANALGIPVVSPGIVLEGGSIDVNGQGSLLTTEQCLLNPNRNPGLSREEIEGYLGRYLGAVNVLWLGEGVAGDDTDGHVDDIARFVGPSTVVAVVEDDPADENHAPLQDNLRRLRSMADESGRPLDVVPLPTPGVVEIEGQRVPASYANFLVTNGLVLVPTFGVPQDGIALETLARCFPGHKVHGLDCRDLIWGLGAVHCLTCQIPDSRRQRPGGGTDTA